MFKSIRSGARSVALLAGMAALTVGGVAVAQEGSGGGDPNHGLPPSGKQMPPPPGIPMSKDLTYAELHVQHDGQAEVLRLDSGEVVAVDDSSITIRENDGKEVTIPVDAKTDVLAGPGHKTEVADLEAGQQVIVCGPEGGTAKTIILPPKRGQMPPPIGGHAGGPPGAAPGGQQGDDS